MLKKHFLKFSYLSILLFVLGFHRQVSPKIFDPSIYKKVVISFYDHILNDDNITIQEYSKLFGRESVISEEGAFMEKCLKEPNSSKENCVNKLQKQFINLDSVTSLMFLKYKKKANIFLPVNAGAIFSIIDSSEVESNKLILNFDRKRIYFSMGYEEDLITPIIHGIYGTDGSSILNKNDFIRFQGGVVDKDGYVNVREKPSIDGNVIHKLYEDDFVWYTPTTESNWWRVYSIDRVRFIGYVHSTRLCPFRELKRKQQFLIVNNNKAQHPWVTNLINN